jgi:hypothetical protein
MTASSLQVVDVKKREQEQFAKLSQITASFDAEYEQRKAAGTLSPELKQAKKKLLEQYSRLMEENALLQTGGGNPNQVFGDVRKQVTKIVERALAKVAPDKAREVNQSIELFNKTAEQRLGMLELHIHGLWQEVQNKFRDNLKEVEPLLAKAQRGSLSQKEQETLKRNIKVISEDEKAKQLFLALQEVLIVSNSKDRLNSYRETLQSSKQLPSYSQLKTKEEEVKHASALLLQQNQDLAKNIRGRNFALSLVQNPSVSSRAKEAAKAVYPGMVHGGNGHYFVDGAAIDVTADIAMAIPLVRAATAPVLAGAKAFERGTLSLASQIGRAGYAASEKGLEALAKALPFGGVPPLAYVGASAGGFGGAAGTGISAEAAALGGMTILMMASAGGRGGSGGKIGETSGTGRGSSHSRAEWVGKIFDSILTKIVAGTFIGGAVQAWRYFTTQIDVDRATIKDVNAASNLKVQQNYDNIVGVQGLMPEEFIDADGQKNYRIYRRSLESVEEQMKGKSDPEKNDFARSEGFKDWGDLVRNFPKVGLPISLIKQERGIIQTGFLDESKKPIEIEITRYEEKFPAITNATLKDRIIQLNNAEATRAKNEEEAIRARLGQTTETTTQEANTASATASRASAAVAKQQERSVRIGGDLAEKVTGPIIADLSKAANLGVRGSPITKPPSSIDLGAGVRQGQKPSDSEGPFGRKRGSNN